MKRLIRYEVYMEEENTVVFIESWMLPDQIKEVLEMLGMTMVSYRKLRK